MAQNRPKKAPEPVKPKEPKYQFYKLVNRVLPLDKVFAETETTSAQDERIPIRFFYFLTWLVLLLVTYERIGYWSEQNARKSIKLTRTVEELRAEYTSIKAEYMKSGKQSAILEKVASDSLQESLTPPHKVVVSKSEYK